MLAESLGKASIASFKDRGLPGSTGSKEPTCNAGDIMRCGLHPWVGKVLLRRAWQPTLVFLSGESPWTEEPGGLQSMGSQRVGHYCKGLLMFLFLNHLKHFENLDFSTFVS